MTIPDINTPGVPQAAATVFVWLADKILGGAKKALGWGWERGQWAAAQDRYDEQVIRQYGWIRIFGQTTPKPLREVFTDVYMLDKPTAFTRFDPHALRLHMWEQDRGMPFRYSERLPSNQLLGRGSKFLILGKPGAGKTTFLKHLAVREAQRGKWGRCLGKVPIFVPLKQFAETGKSLFDFIVEQFAVCHFPDAAPFVERLLKEGKALVLFDGLDEVAKAAEARDDRRGQVTQAIEQFARHYDGCHIIVTCRIAAIEYTLDPAFIYLELADFAPDQVEAFVRNWFWDAADPEWGAGLANRMLAEWVRPEHEGIRDLGRNPLLLTLLCLSYAETLSFPARRVEIYQEALDALLKKWDSSRQNQRESLYKGLSLGRKRQMFSRIAYDGFTQGEILFPQADLEARLKAYLAHVPEAPPEAVDIDTETVLREIVEQHGIFAEQSRGFFSFSHLTFQEYYVARFLTEGTAPDVFEPLLARVTDDKWREVFLLTASFLPDGTHFLARLEGALHNLIASYPRLVAWLRWVNEQTVPLAAYRPTAMRVFYVRALSGALNPPLNRDLERELDRTFDLDLDLALVCARARDRAQAQDRALDRKLARTIDRALTYHPGRAFDLAYARARATDLDLSALLSRVRTSCLQLGETSLNAALSALIVPPEGAPRIMLEQFATQLNAAAEAHGALARLGRLQSAVDALVKSEALRFKLDSYDLGRLLKYLLATQIFYDCLQLAYTPDRRAFEDRIFLPPPLTKQEA